MATRKISADASSAQAAIEAARRAAIERAKRAAEEAAKKAAADAAKQAAAAAAKSAAKNERLGISASATRAGGFKKTDELSTGRGSALRNTSLSATGAGLSRDPLTSTNKRFSVTELLAAQKTGAPSVVQGTSTARSASSAVQETVDSVISPTATQAQRDAAVAKVQQYVDQVGGVGDSGITQAALYGRAHELLTAERIPTAASERVQEQVDVVLGDDATPAQRQQAYAEVQRYVDSVGGLGDSGIIAEALPQRAAELLTEKGIPTIDPRVASAVDAQLADGATADQRRTAYETVQAYVDQVGGLGDSGITEEALPARINELLADVPGVPLASEAAANRVEQVARDGGSPQQIAEALERETAGLSAPQVDALLKQLEPTLSTAAATVNDDKGNGDQTRAFYGALARVSDKAGESGVESLARAAANGFPNGDLEDVDNAITDAIKAGTGGAFAEALSTELRRLGKTEGAQDVTDAVVEGVKGAKEAYLTAADDYAIAQNRLNTELTQVGGVLTPEQRKEYETKFWELPENKAVKEAAAQKADELSTVLENSAPALEAAAARGDEGAAKQLLEGYQQLARSDLHADEAIAFAGRVNQSSGTLFDTLKAAAPDGDLEKFVSDELIATALPNAQAEIFSKNLEPDGALAELKEMLKPFTDDGRFGRINADVKRMIADISEIRAGNVDPVKRSLESWDNAGKFGRALAVGGIAFGLYGAGQAFANGEIANGVQALLNSSNSGLQLASGLLGTYAQAGKIASSTAGDFAKLAGKFAPGIGLAVDLISLKQNIDALREGGASAGEIVTIVGTGISIIGDVAGFVPALGTAVDAVLTVVGGGLQVLGGLLDGEESQDSIAQREQVELLKQLGFSESDAEHFSLAGSFGLIDGFGPFGLTPEQAREAVKLSSRLNGNALTGALTDSSWVQAIGGAFGVTGADFVQLLKDADFPNNDYYGLFAGPHAEAVELLRNGDVEGYREKFLEELRNGGYAPQALIDHLERAFEQNLPVVTEIAESL